MFNNVKAVLFDLDGTLVDSMWMWKDIDVEFLNKYGMEYPEGLQESIEGMSFSETAEYFKSRFQLKQSLEHIKEEWNEMAWHRYTSQVPLKEGALELLKYLKENNIKAGIATSNSRELVNLIVQKLEVESYFGSIRTACEVEKGKPSPDIYLLVAEDLNVKPEECLVFEDVLPGVMAGKNAGAKVCAVYDAYSVKDTDVKKEAADYYVSSFFELPIFQDKKPDYKLNIELEN
ncbi:HAD family hydrolase [Anaerocolumna sp.]|uniref:HAD family hydrolase n=1 Tax=Anaerocolumna sp. TaxID=2041569 RepID=UPI0028AFF385|nr:HAD family phosphatase [Anaerocolumna sp.]